MIKKYFLNSGFYILTLCWFFSTLFCAEHWVDYNSISEIKLGDSRENVISLLGEPILVLGTDEYDNTIYLFYNYHIKSYKTIDENSVDDKNRLFDKERSTLLKFTFVDDNLVSWEEDKLTLAMSKSKRGNGSFLQYFSLLINLVLLVKII